MSTNMNIVSGETGGTNVNVNKVLPQHVVTSDLVVNVKVNTSYELTHSTILQNVLLPIDADSTAGDVFALIGTGAGLFGIAQAAGDQVLFGINSTTAGVAGSLDSTQVNNVLYLRKTIDPGVWIEDGAVGNFLIDGATLVNSINNTTMGGVTLSSTGTGGTDLVTGGGGPNLTIAKINATTGVSGSFVDGAYTMVNTAPDQTVTFTSPASNITFGGSYPALTGSVSNLAISAFANRLAGQILTWNAVGIPTAVPTGDIGQVLTSGGLGDFPTFQDVVAGGLEIGYVQMVGELWASGPSFTFPAPNPLFGDFILVGASYFDDNTANFTHTADGKLQYTGPTKRFSITASFSSASHEHYAGAIAVNGVQDTNSDLYIQDTDTVTVQFTKILNTNDIVSLFAARSSTAGRFVTGYSLRIIG